MYNASLPKLSLKYQTINIFKSQIIQNTLDKFKCAGKAILILDSVASELISKYMTMTELISQGIFSVESLYVSRKPYRRCNAIYIIQCTEENFKLISKDFISEDKRLYENCHIFLLDGVGNYSNLVTQCMTQHLKSFSSFSIKYSILDKNLYYFGTKNGILEVDTTKTNTSQCVCHKDKVTCLTMKNNFLISGSKDKFIKKLIIEPTYSISNQKYCDSDIKSIAEINDKFFGVVVDEIGLVFIDYINFTKINYINLYKEKLLLFSSLGDGYFFGNTNEIKYMIIKGNNLSEKTENVVLN